MSHIKRLLFCTFLTTLAPVAQAQSGADLLPAYLAAARVDEPGLRAFSAQRGKQFFHAEQGGASCATCHGKDARAIGKHVRTGKAIEPLAPIANPQRLSDPAKVEKWFKRNCNDVFKRACSAREKGDVVTWLLSIK